VLLVLAAAALAGLGWAWLRRQLARRRRGLTGWLADRSAAVRRLAVRARLPRLVAEVGGPGESGAVSAQALVDLLRDAAALGFGPTLTAATERR